MRKLCTFILATWFTTSALATTFIYNADGTQTQTIDGITIKLEKGGNANNAPAYSSYNGMKIYANNTISIDAEQTFKNVQLVFSKNEGKDYLTMSASNGTIADGGVSTALDDKKIDVWTGETSHLVFTLGNKGQRVIYQIVVDGEPVELNSETYIDDTPLDPDFEYSEPTAVLVPDKKFFKKEYAFIDSNIRVSCSLGSILNDSNYFNCNANNTLTFEATKPIKGVVINGYVRKQFSASVNNGEIEYCSPGELEEDHEGYPVVIITDIHSTSVTISCDKQLRCYSVLFYFDANPDAELDCGDGPSGAGETFFLTYDAADAVYESEISEDEGKTNYSIYLYNQGTEFPYIVLDLYPVAQGDLTGLYDYEEGSLGEYSWYQESEDALTRTWITEGSLAITRDGGIYAINGYLTCDDFNTYNFTFSGPMPFYTDDEYYGNEEGIEHTDATDSEWRKVLRDGRLLLLYKDRVYTVTGQVL